MKFKVGGTCLSAFETTDDMHIIHDLLTKNHNIGAFTETNRCIRVPGCVHFVVPVRM